MLTFTLDPNHPSHPPHTVIVLRHQDTIHPDTGESTIPTLQAAHPNTAFWGAPVFNRLLAELKRDRDAGHITTQEAAIDLAQINALKIVFGPGNVRLVDDNFFPTKPKRKVLAKNKL